MKGWMSGWGFELFRGWVYFRVMGPIYGFQLEVGRLGVMFTRKRVR